MSAAELRAGASLAGVFGLRMLGLFLILPVFAVHAPTLAGGDNLTLVGIALGAYGLSQAILQIPFGMASDRWGRKPVIYVGLLIFAAGSFVAAGAHDIRHAEVTADLDELTAAGDHFLAPGQRPEDEVHRCGAVVDDRGPFCTSQRANQRL